MELRHLRYFVAVAEELHFGKAAARLQMAQPPLSQQIRQLEEELGLTLIDRTRRHVRLTEAGQVFLDQARRTLAQASDAIVAAKRAARGEIGRLVVGFVTSATYRLLPLILSEFRLHCPDVQLSLQEMTTSQQLHALRANGIDIGFLRPPIQGPGLALEVILQEPLVVALPADHPLAAAPPLPLSAFAAEPFILFPRYQGPGLHDVVVNACKAAGFLPFVVQEATQMETITALVAGRVGIALVPGSVQLLARPGVVYKSLAASPVVELAMAWRSDESRTLLHRFQAVARAVMGKNDPGEHHLAPRGRQDGAHDSQAHSDPERKRPAVMSGMCSPRGRTLW